MEFFADPMIAGLSQLVRPDVLFMIVAGTVVGLGFGIVPGLQSVTALSVFLPVSYYWDPILSMYFFAGVIGSAGNGGAITSILLNMPGTAQNAATMLEGYPLTKKGRAIYALALSASASGAGAVFGVVALVAALPVFLPLLLKFGPAEIFWIATFGLVTLVLAVNGDPAKGLVTVGLGVILAIVGLGGPGLPVPRFTFDSLYLYEGLNLVVVVIGLLVVSEAFGTLVAGVRMRQAAHERDPLPPAPDKAERRTQLREGLVEPLRRPWLFIRSSAIGTFVGAIPGVGGTVAQFMSYNAALASSKNPEEFGKGSVEGLIATEAATNAKDGGALLPTLLFGIPGSADMALLLAAWQLHGLRPGPSFLETNGAIAWALIFGLLFSNILNSIFTAVAAPGLSRLPRVDPLLVAPIVLCASMVSVYAIRENFWDVALVIGFGLLGYLQKLFGYPVIGVVIGFVLGGVMEFNFYLALQSSLGDPVIFVTGPISLALAVGTVIATVWCAVRMVKRGAGARAGGAA
ncbi:tripartite tricarboxylate transporter permease [Acuticoccus kandeliae]|uniref:tripartite tricarboxylate transporter permease n=1 Tax=Acuticoccus kandeliae TaxID=2073160 RepID=UPI000D3E6649|nr:tripartite tricarboxylate transporter permease [Acuticoccus kandeliae]